MLMPLPLLQQGAAAILQPLTLADRAIRLHPLFDEDKAEVLHFLAARPLHTVFLSGFINDNGLSSPMNRGRFYGARNDQGELEGVALIGHATLVEARSEAAVAAFARLAQEYPHTSMILGEKEKVARFWSYFAENGQTPRRISRQLLFEQRWPVEARKPINGLRLAVLDDLPVLLPVYVEMTIEESGVDPQAADPEGYRNRWARRVEMGRVWVWTENNRLVFNADVICDTTDAIYLEGIYVNPQYRGRGYGLRCLSQLSSHLLRRTESVCLLVNEQNDRAQALYRAAGFKMRGYSDSIYLHEKK
jgi:hypothetical protein